MTRVVGGLVDATHVVRLQPTGLGLWYRCPRLDHCGRFHVRYDVARGGWSCGWCGLEWCEGGQHKR